LLTEKMHTTTKEDVHQNPKAEERTFTRYA
jgi:hypothetical protein